jgi:hypothetical protein
LVRDLPLRDVVFRIPDLQNHDDEAKSQNYDLRNSVHCNRIRDLALLVQAVSVMQRDEFESILMAWAGGVLAGLAVAAAYVLIWGWPA